MARKVAPLNFSACAQGVLGKFWKHIVDLSPFPPSPGSGLGMSAGSFSRTAAGNLASHAGVFREVRLSCGEG